MATMDPRYNHGQYRDNVASHQSAGHAEHLDASRGVGFDDSKKDKEYRQKILTIKYGKDQMKLIRKRIAIEDWLDNQLKVLYRCKNDTDDYDTEIDLDEVLDLDTIPERQHFLRSKVSNARQSPDVVNKFIEDILVKVDTL